MAKIHLDAINKAEALLTGLKNNQNRLSEKGFKEYFIQKLESDNNTAKGYNDEYEKLKAGYKSKTIQLNIQVAEVKKQYSEAKKFIKSHFNPTEWPSFGIADKQRKQSV
jgi:hypothetical protein